MFTAGCWACSVIVCSNDSTRRRRENRGATVSRLQCVLTIVTHPSCWKLSKFCFKYQETCAGHSNPWEGTSQSAENTGSNDSANRVLLSSSLWKFEFSSEQGENPAFERKFCKPKRWAFLPSEVLQEYFVIWNFVIWNAQLTPEKGKSSKPCRCWELLSLQGSQPLNLSRVYFCALMSQAGSELFWARLCVCRAGRGVDVTAPDHRNGARTAAGAQKEGKRNPALPQQESSFPKGREVKQCRRHHNKKENFWWNSLLLLWTQDEPTNAGLKRKCFSKREKAPLTSWLVLKWITALRKTWICQVQSSLPCYVVMALNGSCEIFSAIL